MVRHCPGVQLCAGPPGQRSDPEQRIHIASREGCMFTFWKIVWFVRTRLHIAVCILPFAIMVPTFVTPHTPVQLWTNVFFGSLLTSVIAWLVVGAEALIRRFPISANEALARLEREEDQQKLKELDAIGLQQYKRIEDSRNLLKSIRKG